MDIIIIHAAAAKSRMVWIIGIDHIAGFLLIKHIQPFPLTEYDPTNAIQSLKLLQGSVSRELLAELLVHKLDEFV